jgi:predicted XRE-type DNA-binding protein
MKVRSVKYNNRKKSFEIRAVRKVLQFPYSKAEPPPTARDPIRQVFVDKELGDEGFTYVLQSGREGTVHIDRILEYNQDPSYLRDALLYKLTVEAENRLKQSPLSRREIIRRLGTSATQFYRLLDAKNYRKSVDQMLALLHVLDCEIDLVVRKKGPPSGRAA